MSDRITVQLPVEGLLFWKLSGQEAMSEMFRLTLTVLGTDARLDHRKLLGQSVTVTIPGHNPLSPRYINGKITHVAVHATELSGTRYAAYEMTVEPDLWPMTRDRNLRIFQGQTVPQIVKTLLNEYQVNVDDKLTDSYRVWDYCVQYQESSFDFISRLMELEGVAYHFRHEADRHTMVLMDSASQYQPFRGYETIPYHQTPSGGTTSAQGISLWTPESSVTPGLYSLDDYDFRKPNAWLFQAQQNPVSPQPGNIDVYEWPGRFVEPDHAERYARIRQQRWQVEYQQITATATATGIAPGYTFTLLHSPFAGDNGEYLTISADYDIEENRYASGDNSSPTQQIFFTVIPATAAYRPAQRTPWPRTYGPQTARVVGPEGKSIWTDKYGRIKVQFHWDRDAKGDDTSSCWLRVSSAWAGQGFGSVQIPRVGDEVVIDFINGDPDRPIVTGRVYNEASMPPWALPAAETQMGFMTRSKDGHKENASYLFFDDKAGKEAVEMHAEKDMTISVENNQQINIDGNRTTIINQQQTDDVKGNAILHYHSKLDTTVDDKDTQIFNKGQEITIHKGREQTIESGEEKITVRGNRTTIIEGEEDYDVIKKVTQTFYNGLETNITKGKEETIQDGVDITLMTGDWKQKVTDGDMTINLEGGNWKQEINGDVKITVKSGSWTQKVTDGELEINCPKKITLKSKTKIDFDAPVSKINAKGCVATVTGLSLNITGISRNIKGDTVTLEELARSSARFSFSWDMIGYSGRGIDLNRSINAINKTVSIVFYGEIDLSHAKLILKN